MKTPNRELIFGLIAPVGVDRRPVTSALRDELIKVGYAVETVKVSQQIAVFAEPYAEHDYFERKSALMDAGNAMRRWHRKGDAAALLAMLEFGKSRKKRRHANNILTKRAYIVDSLKHPDEVELLQSVYGPAFVGVALYEAPATRRKRIVDEANSLLKPFDPSLVDKLMTRDEDEGLSEGQKVRAAFELADFVLNLSSPTGSTNAQIWRLVRCLFGDVQVTPTIHEYGMSLAYAAQAKSSSLARQVGASILRPDGSVASVGTNEVARAGGGQYTEADDEQYPRGRDVNRDQDSSDLFRHRAMTDLIRRLQEEHQLSDANQVMDPSELFNTWWTKEKWLRKSYFAGTIDYVRAVHAEMSAISDAARNGVELNGTALYATTFPCHDCAKHIVASGISEVIYLAPYPKSLVADLYDDSIEINASAPSPDKVHFHSFVGVMPRRYSEFFYSGKRDRKDEVGRPIRFEASKATLTLPAYAPAPESVVAGENALTLEFAKKLAAHLKSKRGTPTGRRASRSGVPRGR